MASDSGASHTGNVSRLGSLTGEDEPGGRPSGEHRPDAERTIVASGLALAVVAVAAQSLVYLVGRFALDVDVLHEDAAEAFRRSAGASALAAAAAAAVALATVRHEGARRAAALAAILAYFAIDKAVEIHHRLAERMLDVLHVTRIGPRGGWLLLYAPLVLLAAVLVLRCARGAPPAARLSLRAGIAALGVALAVQAGWVVVEWRDSLASAAPGSGSSVVEVVVEEGLELGGWLLVAAGLAAAAWSVRAPKAHVP